MSMVPVSGTVAFSGSSQGLINAMQRLSSKISRVVVSSFSAIHHTSNTSHSQMQWFSFHVNRQQQQEAASIPGYLVRWGSLGFYRTSKFASGFMPLQPKPLDSIIDLERAKHRLPEDLAMIWDDYHLGRGHIGASMKAKLYHLLEQRAAQCRYFVIPLWRGSGYTTMFLQVQMPHMLFTGLEDYKARGTQAAPYFTVTHYTEFAESKDLVLIRGDVVFTSKLSDSEAKWLLEIAQSFYLNDVRYKLVERFNKETRDFEFKDVLQALDMPIL
ncbi:ATP11 [Dillenia turbinata]|uniref:ATP11 n=1 Tax=Dillenia turbinata TaxID=194707 RepID=A0AAN8UIZ1_9MAGN